MYFLVQNKIAITMDLYQKIAQIIYNVLNVKPLGVSNQIIYHNQQLLLK